MKEKLQDRLIREYWYARRELMLKEEIEINCSIQISELIYEI